MPATQSLEGGNTDMKAAGNPQQATQSLGGSNTGVTRGNMDPPTEGSEILNDGSRSILTLEIINISISSFTISLSKIQRHKT